MTDALQPTTDRLELKSLLDAANQASTQVALLHVAFTAMTLYVLVIVSGTTDLDLIIGKGVKLPIVDVEIPIVGFYASVPVLVVLVHFNLLLQLQLLSRKLYLLEAQITQIKHESARPALLSPVAVGADTGIRGDERDLLHIFPCTHFLVGQYDGLIRRCLSIVTAISLLLLPLATLLLVQLRFLAYQSETITWLQRAAVWTDVGVIVILWPVIMDRLGRWSRFLRQVVMAIRTHLIVTAIFVVIFVAILVTLFIPPVTAGTYSYDYLLPICALAALVLLAIMLAVTAMWVVRFVKMSYRRPRAPRPPAQPAAQRGVGAFVVAVALGCVLPVALVVKGESLEHLTDGETAFSSASQFRTLHAEGRTLFAKPPTAEVLDSLGGDMARRLNALKKVDRINLSNRNFRGADFSSAILTGADFRNADLEGARFDRAHLEGAQFDNAFIATASFGYAFAESASFANAGSWEGESSFEGARLDSANFASAWLSTANFAGGHLAGTVFDNADLQGASFKAAYLKAASFACATMDEVDLRYAALYATEFRGAKTHLIDIRETSWDEISDSERQELHESRSAVRGERSDIEGRICAAPRSSPPHYDSCLKTETQGSQYFVCSMAWDQTAILAYREQLYGALGDLVCSRGGAYSIAAEVRTEDARDRWADSRFGPGIIVRLRLLSERKDCVALQDPHVQIALVEAYPY